MTNDTLKVIASRYSCRDYTDEMPSDEQLKAIADAALAAPSAMNRQGWRVIVVKDQALIKDLEAEGMRVLGAAEDRSAYERIQSRGGKLFYNAPCMVIIAMDKSNGSGMDCGILCQNVALAATSLGLGSVICGLAGVAFSADKKAEFEKRLGFPEGFEFSIAVLLGTAVKEGAPHPLDTAKLSIIG